MTKYFDHYIAPQLYRNERFYNFLKAHDAEVNWDYDKMKGIPFHFILQIIQKLGYNIEVTEVSAAEKAVGSVKGQNWHRLHQYRWSVVYWDDHGTMISLSYSDNNEIKFFDSEDAAYRNAIDFIMENYLDLVN